MSPAERTGDYSRAYFLRTSYDISAVSSLEETAFLCPSEKEEEGSFLLPERKSKNQSVSQIKEISSYERIFIAIKWGIVVECG